MVTSDLPFPMPKNAMLHVKGLHYPLVAVGKVREIYDTGDAFLIIATDRLSAFDVVMNEGLPGKGILLTQISLYWFALAEALVDHHLVVNHKERILELSEEYPDLQYRSMFVKKLNPLPIEAIVRGYLSGSGWKAYMQTGRLFEHDLPLNLLKNSLLPRPIFTPTTKAGSGHDMPIDRDEAIKLIGEDLFRRVHNISIDLYQMGLNHAKAAGIILADTKFEFGTDSNGKLFLIDEIFTPDSSRYWPKDQHARGKALSSYDKQFIRDYLDSLDWDKTPPPPPLTDNVLAETLSRYVEAYMKITQ